MKKLMYLILVVFLVFALAACGGKTSSTDPTNDNAGGGNGSQVTEPSKPAEPADKNDKYTYEPEKAPPKNLPVYPGAVMVYDSQATGYKYGENSWQWHYDTAASGNEIVAFFRAAFQDLGIPIDEDYTLANFEEFFIQTNTLDSRTASVGWLGYENSENKKDDELSPDTKGRGYMILVDLDRWAERTK